MNIVFIGSSKFGLRCLELLRSLPDLRVRGVVTAPQTFSISYRPEGVTNVLYADVGNYCRTNDIPCVVMQSDMKDESLFASVSAWEPDIFLVVGWYHMVPRRWRKLAPAYGLHASLLPDYSGGAPLVWAMINGDKETGITLFQFDSGVDSGPILGQSSTVIDFFDTIATLYARIENLGLELIQKRLPALADGSARLIPQDDSKRRIFPQRSPEDGRIDWELPTSHLYDFIRAQTRPYPGAFTTWKGKPLHVWRALPAGSIDTQKKMPGQIIFSANKCLVNTGNGLLEILEAQYDGKDINGCELRLNFEDGAILGI